MDHVTLLKELAAAWVAEDHPHAKPAADAEIAAFESRHGVRLPSDLRAYFATLNGGDLGHEGSTDHEMISFWRLDQVRTQAELNEGKGGRTDLFGFADWSVDCHTYEIELHSAVEEATPVFIDYGPELQKVADSFSAFLEGYLAGDHRVLYGISREPSA
jgi:hypothetical protein